MQRDQILHSGSATARTAVATPEAASPARWFVALWREWRYVGGKRDLRLDLLRGFAVFAMVANHIGGESSWLYTITGGNRFFVTAAELFVFLSGLVMGLVYGRSIPRRGLEVALVKVLRRVALLYILAVIFSFVFGAGSAWLGLTWGPSLEEMRSLEYVISVVTFHRTFYLADVLLLYTILVLLAGPLLVLLVRQRTGLVLAGSWFLWGIWQFFPEQAQIPWPIVGNDLFNIAAWQVLFVTGLVAGFHHRTLSDWLSRMPAEAILVVSGGLLALGLRLHHTGFEVVSRVTTDETFALITEQFYGKADVRIGRLVAFVVVFAFLYSFVTVAWVPIQRALGWLLLPLGQRALVAYVWHMLLVMVLVRLRAFVPSLKAQATSANTMLQILGVAVIWVIVQVHPTIVATLRRQAALVPRLVGRR